MLRYRLIHYAPDHFAEERFIAGALLDEGDTVAVLAAVPPCDRCIGARANALLRLVMASLGEVAPSFHSLPEHCGPHFELGRIRTALADIADPRGYVMDTLPKRTASPLPSVADGGR